MSDEFLMSPQGSTAVLDAEDAVETASEPLVKAGNCAHDQSVPHIHNGYGACSASGCYCQSYSGSAYTCANCGHNYATHW